MDETPSLADEESAPARSAPDDPADLDGEGEGERQQREHGDGHQGSLAVATSTGPD